MSFRFCLGDLIEPFRHADHRRRNLLNGDQFEWLSFDCYGTLVDWESGICDSVSNVLTRHGTQNSTSEILAMFSEIEPKVQGRPGYLGYRGILHEVMQSMATELNLVFSADELDSLAESLPNWPIFPDVIEALKTLKERYKLAVISNVDDDLFALTVKALNVDFDLVVTAQQIQSYKPNLRNFQTASTRMKVGKQNWLHVAESLYHDIAPANRLGIKSVWVNRPSRGGGTRLTDAVPDAVVQDLAALTEILCPD